MAYQCLYYDENERVHLSTQLFYHESDAKEWCEDNLYVFIKLNQTVGYIW